MADMPIPTQTGRVVADLRTRVAKVEARASTDPKPLVDAEAQTRAAADTAEAKARGDADAAEVAARIAAVKVVADGLAAEATARAAGDKTNADAITSEADRAKAAEVAMQARVVTLNATLVLPAGLSVVVGKTERKVTVAGLKKGDGITVTPTAALPGNMTLGDAYCLTDGELTLSTIVTGTLALSISTATSVPLIIKALR